MSNENRIQVAKWGNSLAIRFPTAVVEALELREGDDPEIHFSDGNQFAIARKLGREELLKRQPSAGSQTAPIPPLLW
jgi:antitoxin MazE